MIRLLIIALSALMATTAATSASAGEIKVKVKVAGRDTAAVHAEIVQAAKQLCQEDLIGNPYAVQIAPYCVRDVARDAISRARSRDLVAYDKAQGRDVYFLKIAAR